ncbi:hypothetical protein WICPIJ_010116 [Wickerhamomyces pijperi]|uniref:Putative zinc-finger domain-containing protein n=1 Tax=Wickerhamomyces pijperi TaxID=599730 RepID=A0A9P8PHM7_WICPI|nr:hypothetical protein WICPIJ_010116 [Wickerhamomyces pijperi]
MIPAMSISAKESLELELQAKRKALLESIARKKKAAAAAASKPSVIELSPSSSEISTPIATNVTPPSSYQSSLSQQDISSMLYEAVVDLQSLGYSFNMIVEKSGINRHLLQECFKNWNFATQPDAEMNSPSSVAMKPNNPATVVSRNGTKMKTNSFAVLAATSAQEPNEPRIQPQSQPQPQVIPASRSPTAVNAALYNNQARPRYNTKVFQNGSVGYVERPEWLDDLVLDFQTTDEELSDAEADAQEEVLVIEENVVNEPATLLPNNVAPRNPGAGQDDIKQKLKDLQDEIARLSSIVKINESRKLDEVIQAAELSIKNSRTEQSYLLAKLQTLEVVIKKECAKLDSLKEEAKKLHDAKAHLALLLIEQDDLEKELPATKKSNSKKKKRRPSTHKSAPKPNLVEPQEDSNSTKQPPTTSISMHEALRQRLLNMKRKKEEEEQMNTNETGPSKRHQSVKIEAEEGRNTASTAVIEITDDEDERSSKAQVEQHSEDDDDDDIEEIPDPCPPLKAKEREIVTNSESADDEDGDSQDREHTTGLIPNFSRTSETEESAIYGETIHKIEKVIIIHRNQNGMRFISSESFWLRLFLSLLMVAKSSQFKPYVSYGLSDNQSTTTKDTGLSGNLEEGQLDQLCPLELVNGSCTDKSCKFQHLS